MTVVETKLRDGERTWNDFCCRVFTVIFMVVTAETDKEKAEMWTGWRWQRIRRTVPRVAPSN